MSYRESQLKFEEIFKDIGPSLVGQPAKIVMIQLMVTLKLQGILGEELTEKDIKMLKTIHDSIMLNHDKRHDALKFAQQLLE